MKVPKSAGDPVLLFAAIDVLLRAVLGVVPMRRASFNRAIEMSLPFNVKLLFISHPVLSKRK